MKKIRNEYSFVKIFFTVFILWSFAGCSGCIVPEEIITWEKTFGGSSFERAYTIQQTTDGGYIVAGQTSSFSSGGYDYYIIKLDNMGVVEWQNNFGGSSAEIARDVQQTADGGYILAGRSSSFKVGYCDFYIIKLDSDGTKAWEQVYGGSTWDDPNAIEQTADGGYIVAGYTDSIGSGGNDVYVMKLDSEGEQEWEDTYGGADSDVASAVQQTADGGYIVAGYTGSSGAGSWDVYVLKIDSTGTVVWEQTYGGSGYDAAESVQQTADGGYIVAGYTESSGAGGRDMYVLRLDSAGVSLGEKTYGGLNDDHAYSIQQTKDSNFVIAGVMGSADNTDMYLAKLNSSGTKLWEKSYGGSDDDAAYDVQQTADNGFIVAGYTHPSDAAASHDDDMYVLKLNRVGSL